MPIRLREVGLVLVLILSLIMAKRMPLVSALPLTQAIGVICFTFAIYLALQLFHFELARIRAEE